MTLILQSVALSRVLERPEIPNEQLWYIRSDRLRRYARECIALRFVSLYRCLSWQREQTRGGGYSGRMGTYERLVFDLKTPKIRLGRGKPFRTLRFGRVLSP